MSILPLREYPDPILHQKAQSVAKIDDEIRLFLDDMLETMYADRGAGLAAPQVGVSKRMIVLDAEQKEQYHQLFLRYFKVSKNKFWRMSSQLNH